MGRDALIETGHECALAAHLLNGGRRDMFMRFDGGEQPRTERALPAPVLPQYCEQTGRQRNVAVFGPFALLHTDIMRRESISAGLRLTASAIRRPAP